MYINIYIYINIFHIFPYEILVKLYNHWRYEQILCYKSKQFNRKFRTIMVKYFLTDSSAKIQILRNEEYTNYSIFIIIDTDIISTLPLFLSLCSNSL